MVRVSPVHGDYKRRELRKDVNLLSRNGATPHFPPTREYSANNNSRPNASTTWCSLATTIRWTHHSTKQLIMHLPIETPHLSPSWAVHQKRTLTGPYRSFPASLHPWLFSLPPKMTGPKRHQTMKPYSNCPNCFWTMCTFQSITPWN